MIAMKRGNLSTGWCIVLWILPVVTGLIALGIGRIWISPSEIAASFAGLFGAAADVPVLTRMTLWNLRLPRILLAALAGAGLSTAGSAFQSLFANPLATPDTLGVASGASFGAGPRGARGAFSRAAISWAARRPNTRASSRELLASRFLP